MDGVRIRKPVPEVPDERDTWEKNQLSVQLQLFGLLFSLSELLQKLRLILSVFCNILHVIYMNYKKKIMSMSKMGKIWTMHVSRSFSVLCAVSCFYILPRRIIWDIYPVPQCCIHTCGRPPGPSPAPRTHCRLRPP